MAKMTEFLYPSSFGGCSLPYRNYEGDSPARAAVIIVPELYEKCTDYEELCKGLSASGIFVHMYEINGEAVLEGENKSALRGRSADKALVSDLVVHVRLVRKKYRMLPLYIYGHGTGALAALAAVSSNDSLADGMILSGIYTDCVPSGMTKRYIEKMRKKLGGEARVPKAQNKLFARMLKHCDKGADAEQLLSYSADLYECSAVAELISYIYSEEFIKRAPRSVSTILLSGADSAVSGRGKGIADFAQRLLDADMSDVRAGVYKDVSHTLIGTKTDALVRDIGEWVISHAQDVVLARRMDFI